MKILNIIKNTNWSSINLLGKSQFSRTSYYYLVIIPIIVKGIKGLESPLTFRLDDYVLTIPLELPFSWILFYFGAISFAIGASIYYIFCPKLIKDFKNYGEYQISGASDDYLLKLVKKYSLNNDRVSVLTTYTPWVENYHTESKSTSQRTHFLTGYKHNLKFLEARKDVFFSLKEKIELIKPVARIFSVIFYGIGFLMFLIVLGQNILFVIEFILN